MTDAEKVLLSRQTLADIDKTLRESVDDSREIPEILDRIAWVLARLEG